MGVQAGEHHHHHHLLPNQSIHLPTILIPPTVALLLLLPPGCSPSSFIPVPTSSAAVVPLPVSAAMGRVPLLRSSSLWRSFCPTVRQPALLWSRCAPTLCLCLRPRLRSIFCPSCHRRLPRTMQTLPTCCAPIFLPSLLLLLLVRAMVVAVLRPSTTSSFFVFGTCAWSTSPLHRWW